ncbi:hypothetical protein Esi_0504_0009 [Ectocarpus siliculosus]|uniref:Uncharacterized protein n=1 Tax=Ectocarpus siliculosus TaxID=2880 RepID=D7G3C9_ECTSI|nr:hypothetical protein Esi_0504_0009 [Ectocarpus siliculosus]|eukprot:CBJ33523.1 hypothetical protein Esi_0504_0009 [Ectocarpus siliculosus]
MGRGLIETVLTLPRRLVRTSRLEDMTDEEKAFACLSSEVYKKPGNDDNDNNNPASDEHRGAPCGYTLLRGEIPAAAGDDGPAVRLNDTRWAAFRAPNQVDHVLAFRGTADRRDALNDVLLFHGDFDQHKYMLNATVWALGGGGGGGLRFSVTGHSLGGTVAMGVMVLLHDIPTTARRRPNDTRYQQQVLGAWNAERANWSGAAAPYELVGGHIFNPGAWPGLVGPVAGGSAVAGFWLTGAFTLTGAAATAAMCAVTVGSGCALALYLYRSHTERLSDRVDKRVTTHHIIGDVVSGFFRLGTEKNYMPKDKRARRLATACSPGKMGKEWGCHSIANFLFPDSAETLPAAAYLEQKESQELQQALLLSKGSNVAGEGSAAAAPEGAAGAWATTNYGDYDEEEIREALRRSAAESEGGAWEEESWEEFADMMAGSMLTNEDQEVCAAIRRSVADTAAAEVAGMTANSMLTNEDEKVWEALCRSFADMVPETRRVAEEEVWEEFANMTASTLACEDLEILEALRRSVSDTAVTSREAGEEEVWDEFTDMATVRGNCHLRWNGGVGR